VSIGRNELSRLDAVEDERVLRTLARVNDAAFNEPGVRARGAAVETFAAAVAPHMDPYARPRRAVVEQGLALVDEGERRRLVARFDALRPVEWREICRDAGDVGLVEWGVAIGAVEGTIFDEVPRPRSLLRRLDGRRLPGLPHYVLALALRPGSIWPLRDAEAAARGSEDAIESYARAHVTDDHAARVRLFASRLRRQLPLRGLPRATARLEAGCRAVAADDGVARETAVLSLCAYVVYLEAA
jgi:hypothetical protein